jgi:hypothetical protein
MDMLGDFFDIGGQYVESINPAVLHEMEPASGSEASETAFWFTHPREV